MSKTKKLGVSFSGGGARASAHAGVVKALNEANIKIDATAGTSGGSIIAALYASGFNVEEMKQFAAEANLFNIYKPTLPLSGLSSLDFLLKLMDNYALRSSFESLNIPCSIVACNLERGEKKVFSSGLLYRAIQASCAIPLVFKPIEIDGQHYVDGGIMDNMPIANLRSLCDVVIGVNIMPNIPVVRKDIDNMIKIGMRVFDLSISVNTSLHSNQFDLVIAPKEILDFEVYDFNKHEDIFSIGYQAGVKSIPEIKRLLESAD